MSDFHERIGEGLVRIGTITQGQSTEILELQKKGDKRLFGEIAMSKGYINFESLISYLKNNDGSKKL